MLWATGSGGGGGGWGSDEPPPPVPRHRTTTALQHSKYNQSTSDANHIRQRGDGMVVMLYKGVKGTTLMR